MRRMMRWCVRSWRTQKSNIIRPPVTPLLQATPRLRTNRARKKGIKGQILLLGCLQRLPAVGVEPTHSCEYWILSPARLPIPPRRRCSWCGALPTVYSRAGFAQLESALGVGAGRCSPRDGLPSIRIALLNDAAAAVCCPARTMPATRLRKYPGRWAIPAPRHERIPWRNMQGL